MCHSALPCDKDCNFIPSTNHPQPPQPLDVTPENPFQDRLAFEFANFYFCWLQALESSINRALQLWAAQATKHGVNNVPWQSVSNVYKTIDQIQQGDNPWKSVPFCYQGPLPPHPPAWMTKKFELVTCDICHVLYEQIACISFNGHWDYSPFWEFNSFRDCVWTNHMSSEWAAKEAVCAVCSFSFFSVNLTKLIRWYLWESINTWCHVCKHNFWKWQDCSIYCIWSTRISSVVYWSWEHW